MVLSTLPSSLPIPELCGGLLLLDKPSGVTCRSAAYQLVKSLGIHPKEKWGFVGTLDPLATGLLPIAVGSATKAIPYVESQVADKTYRATLAVGQMRLGDDVTGEVVAGSSVFSLFSLHRLKMIEQSLSQWGEMLSLLRVQRPPDFSAKHVRGKRAYHWAREGREVLVPPSPVQVKSAQLIQSVLRPDLRQVHSTWELTVSRGGYVRSLARDLGADAGLGGYLLDIRRIQMGVLREDALTWEQTPEGLRVAFVAFSELFGSLPAEDIERVGASIMTGQTPLIKVSQPTEFTSEFTQKIAFSTLTWQGRRYGLFFKPLVHMPGRPYQVLKRIEMSCRINPIQLRGYSHYPASWHGADDQECNHECVTRAERRSI